MRPGEVQSDEQAFRQILGRLEGEVGTMLQLIPEGKKIGLFPDTAPFWSLMRMMFPIAESIGDLIYRTDSSVKNLQAVLEREFEAVRSGYKGKAAILSLLYRHSLTHTDELRTLFTGGRKVGWFVSWSAQEHHLRLLRNAHGVYGIRFDTTAFYEDLVAVCHNVMGKPSGGQVMQRYNGWLILDLDKAKRSNNVKNAISEIMHL